MRRVFSHHSEMLKQLLERSEDLGIRLGHSGHRELQLTVLGTASHDVQLHYEVLHLTTSEEARRGLRPVVDELTITLRPTLHEDTTGQLRLYLQKRGSLEQDSMHHFEYAVRGDLLRLAADRITGKIGEFIHEGEFSFPHQSTWTTGDHDKTLYLRKTQGSHLIG